MPASLPSADMTRTDEPEMQALSAYNATQELEIR